MNPQITQTDTDFDSLEYDEICKQEYAGNNCKISAGFVSGDAKPEVDTIYLKCRLLNRYRIDQFFHFSEYINNPYR